MHSLTLYGELEINKLQSTNTCEHLRKIHSNDFSRYFGIPVSEDNKRPPAICWLPKLNKNPTTKARFIIAAPTSCVKLLSKYITSVFKLIFNIVNSCNKQC